MRLHSRISTKLPLLALGLAVVAACAGNDTPEDTAAVTCPPGMSRAARQNICIEGTCGNGVVDPGEACDDGNRIAGDGCSADCLSTEVCGNGIVDAAVGEVCDSGSTHPEDVCCSDCRSCPERAAQQQPRDSAEPTEPAAPEPPPCSPAELERALAELSANHQADAAHTPEPATHGNGHMLASVHGARARARAAASAHPAHDADIDMKRAHQAMAELQRTNAQLKQLLVAERERVAELERRLSSGRSVELQ